MYKWIEKGLNAMDKGVKAVRESIKQRKKTRHTSRYTSRNTELNHIPYLASDEEKHGFALEPNLIDELITSKKQIKLSTIIKRKLLGTVVLFVVISGILQTDVAYFAAPKQWIETSFQEEFPFAKVSEKYTEVFGSPLALTPSKSDVVTVSTGNANLPVYGDVVETFADNGRGIMISPKETANVNSLDRGVVIFAGNDRQTDKTVIVQHADSSKTIYGHLSSIDVFLYQFVQANEIVGTFEPTTNNENVYFSVVKEQEFIDPAKVFLNVEFP